MAKRQADLVLIKTEIPLTSERMEKLCSSVDSGQPDVDKITGLAIYALEALADGGMLLRPIEVKKIEESIGQPVDDATQILELAERGAGRKDGCLSATWYVDPTYEPRLRDQAEFQSVPVADVVQRMMDEAVDNGWFGEIVPNAARVLMTTEDKASLEALLGKPFSNGTELAELVRGALGASKFTDGL